MVLYFGIAIAFLLKKKLQLNYSFFSIFLFRVFLFYFQRLYGSFFNIRLNFYSCFV
jgi:hypothetical protein